MNGITLSQRNRAQTRLHRRTSARLGCLISVYAVIAAGFTAAPVLAASDTAEAKSIFRKRCTGCHTYGKGIKVGPDLKGVTDRRSREWLLGFIRSSSKTIQAGDPTATALFREFKQERMPDWTDLSVPQISGIIAYFAQDGPLQKEPDERHADTATAAEIDSGRRLFHAITPLRSGARACNTCHASGETAVPGYGTLGPNLAAVYLKYTDRALTDFLKRPCFPRHPEMLADNYLAPQESFDLKAYLAHVAQAASVSPVVRSRK